MKKILFVFYSLFLASALNAQCIVGNVVITLGQTAVFSSSATAQCTSCYDWDINSNATSSDNSVVGNVQIIGSDMGQSVSIKGLSLGNFTLQLRYFDETGCHDCTVTGTVVPVGANCCAPKMTYTYICRGNGASAGGFVKFKAASNCAVNWSAIQKIHLYLGGTATFTVATPLNGLNQGDVYPPFSLDSSGYYTLPIYASNCPTEMDCTATVYFNNGCPPVTTEVIAYSNYPEGKVGEANPSNDYGNKFIKVDQEKADMVGATERIALFPNPTSGIIMFGGKNLENYSISLLDVNGKEIVKALNLSGTINLEDQKEGIYSYIITGPAGYIQTGKIIKE